MSEFSLSYDPDPGGFGMIGASVSAHGWCGETGYAAHINEILPFLACLNAYPLPSPTRLVIGGEFKDGPLISLEIVPADGWGTLRISIQLADDRDRRRRVSTDFQVGYAEVESFRRELKRALEQGGTAKLTDVGRS